MKYIKHFFCLSRIFCAGVLLLVAINADASSKNSPNETWMLERTVEGFSIPVAVTMDKAENLYISNWGGDTVTRVDRNGKMSVFASGLNSPAGSTFDSEENFYVASYSDGVVYRIDKNGAKSVFSKGFHTPTGLTLHSDGGLLVTNRNIGELVKVEKDGSNRVLRVGFDTAAGVLEGPDGEIYVANFDGGVSKLTIGSTGKIDHKIISTEFQHPAIGLFLEKGNLYVVDHGEGAVKKISPEGITETVASGIPSAVGMLKLPDGRVVVTSWTGSLFIFRMP